MQGSDCWTSEDKKQLCRCGSTIRHKEDDLNIINTVNNNVMIKKIHTTNKNITNKKIRFKKIIIKNRA